MIEQTTSALSGTHDNVIVQCRGLTKVFKDFWLRGRVRAVDSIDLDVRQGEIFGLLGPNGSGKSTTIKLALGLLHPSGGTVSVFGQRPSDVMTKRRIGYLPEESYLYRFLNARETLDYYGRLFHQRRTQRRQRIDMLLEMVGLTAVQRRPVGEYSKGMQRRIGLAQALINDPDLLVLDEPTTGLDPIGTRQIKDLIDELAHRGKTVILCSHLLADVEDVCGRVAIMFGGKIRKVGTVDSLLVQDGNMVIQTGELNPATIQKIEQVLQDNGRHIESIDRPRQRLESLFLDIVHEALDRGDPTSGARDDGKLADFLVSKTPSDDDDPARLLEGLMGDTTQAADSPPIPGGASQAPSTKAQPDTSLIDDLMRGDGDTKNDGSSSNPPRPPHADR